MTKSQQADAVISKFMCLSPQLQQVKKQNLEFSPLTAQIRSIVKQDIAIEFVILAFPGKSSNRKKTISALPDYGEYMALKKLQTLCDEISEVYSPGANITICSDGYVFNDLVGLNDEEVRIYAAALRKLIRIHNFSNLRFIQLNDFCQESIIQEKRNWLMNKYAQPLAVIKAHIKSDHKELALFNGIHRFITEDQQALHINLTKNQLRKMTKILTYQVIQRSHAWSDCIQKHFPNAVRLSIHPHPIESLKFGIQMVQSENEWATPWHNVVLMKNGEACLVKREEAENQNAYLVMNKTYGAYYRIGASL